MQAPCPFITCSKGNKLAVSDEAASYLSALTGTVGVATVAGVYRTGKSYILNQLAGQHAGFGIGSTVQAHTKGIWLWGAPLELGGAAAGQPQHMLLLDTEGLQSISQSEGHDAKIFCLAILLSSFFIYNSEKAINNAAIDQLSLVAQLTHKIRVSAEGGMPGGAAAGDAAASLAEFFPEFVWLLRDFQLELTSADGRPMTADEYLEESLRPQPGASSAVLEQNATRAAITKLFLRRSCTALPHPTLGTSLPPSAVKSLPPLASLSAGFRAGVDALRTRVLSSTRSKSLSGVPLTGPMLLELARSYVEAINGGCLPTISTAWQAVITLECGKALREATALYAAGAAAAARADPPLDEAGWASEHERLAGAARDRFRALAVGEGTASFEAELGAAIEAERERAAELMGAKSAALVEKLVGELERSLPRDLDSCARAGEPLGEALPKALLGCLSGYEARAAGAAKAAGRTALHERLMPAVGGAVGSALSAAEERLAQEASKSAAAAKQAAAAREAAGRAQEEAATLLASTRAELEQRLAAANAELQAGAARAGGAAATINSLTSERDAARAEAARAAAESQQLGALAAARAAADGQLQADLASARSERASLVAEVDRLRRELATARAETQAASQAHAQAQAETQAAAAAAQSQAHAAAQAATQAQAQAQLQASAAPDPPAAPPAKRARGGGRVASAKATAKAPAPPPPAAEEEAAPMAVEDVADGGSGGTEGAGPSSAAPKAPKARRLSVDPKDMSVPALQSKLRQALGNDYKLPKKKPDMLKLYMKTFADN